VPPIQQVTSDGLILLQIYDENFNPHSVAYDLNTWAQKWTHDGTPVVALDSGGVVYADDDGTLTQVDDQGQVVNQSTLNGSYDLVSVLHGEGRMNAVDPYTSGVEEVQTGVYRESEESVVTLPSGLVLPFSCVNPPAIPTSKSFFHKSLVAPSDTSQPYSYRFLGDWSALGPQQAAVENAFTEWSDVLEFFAFQYGSPTQGATNIRFRKAADGEGADIGVRRTGDLPKGIAGQFNASGVQPDYHILGGTLFITTDARSVSGPDGYYKVGLHEIGHALGLWHTKRFHGTSVMNDLAGQDDVGGNIPDYVTKCDARKAIEYSLR
jgi:hypothetical protein